MTVGGIGGAARRSLPRLPEAGLLRFHKDKNMDYNAMGRCLGGIYVSLCSALTDEGAQLAHEHLHLLSESPLIRPEDRRVYAAIFDCTNRRIKGDDEFETKRPCLTVITGGAA